MSAFDIDSIFEFQDKTSYEVALSLSIWIRKTAYHNAVKTRLGRNQQIEDD